MARMAENCDQCIIISTILPDRLQEVRSLYEVMVKPRTDIGDYTVPLTKDLTSGGAGSHIRL